MPLIRVVIVDDHDMVRRGLRGLIESRLRYAVIGEASDGREALTVVGEAQPDIVILDYSLPFQDGLSVARTLKELYPRVEIVMFTLFEQERVVSEAIEIGVLGFVLKSEDEKFMLEALESVALGRQYFTPTLAKARKESRHIATSSIGLSAREQEIVQLIAEGLVQKNIAYKLGISIKTVETHRTNALNKLGLATTADLVRYALRNNLVAE
ncbi:response regulator transcription factor [Croceibacterium sp. LX-88]|uniref:Response regulator transcription factor n=1 Tax=Croceibacterium selenioxidans TaxID=2838833 RepID=A0ABS5W7T2_9SPHN|nr:response regulator transcription factor [Croceibacterium selenioxidans]MBT2135816.1 response regulator transcription factor [Croceibacterium selenioxidans]